MNSPVGDPPEFIELNNAEFYSAMADEDGGWVSTKTWDGKSEIYGNPVIMSQGLTRAWQATKIFNESNIERDLKISDKIQLGGRPWWKSKRRVV